MTWQSKYNRPDLLLALARAARAAGQLDQAANLYGRCLQALESTFGMEDICLPPVLNELAELYERQGEIVCSDNLYRRANNILAIYAGQLVPQEQQGQAPPDSADAVLRNGTDS